MLLVALSSLWLGGCQSVPSAADTSAPAYTTKGYVPSPPRAALIRAAAGQIGTPYRYGGNNRRGFDCSGLVQYAHRQIGIDVPRTTRQQWSQAQQPERRHLIPGDLVFFALDGNKSRHVGIYEGGGVFIHAPSSGKRVSRASLDNPFWRQRLLGARTFL
jgi:cell wall-associated NlpC family hydrolase